MWERAANRWVLAAALAALAGGCASEPDWRAEVARWQWQDPLPDLPLVDQDGRALRLHDLRGEPLLVGFVYTRCPDAAACPLTTTRMADVQRAAGERGVALRLLTLTLDPARDDPATLRAFATAHGAELRTWTFATGERELMVDGLPSLFNVLSLPDGERLDHTVKITLLDRELRQVAEWKDNAADAATILASIEALP